MNSKLICECLDKLNMLESHNKVRILYSPWSFNEPADELVKRGAKTPLYLPKIFCGIGKRIMGLTLKMRKMRNDYSWRNMD